MSSRWLKRPTSIQLRSYWNMKCNVKGFVAQSSWPCILYLLDCFSENIWQYVITLHFHSKLLNLVSPRTSIKYDLSLSHIAQIENLLLLGVRSLGFRVFQQATICHQIVKTENGMMFEFIWSKVGWESSRSWCHFIYIYIWQLCWALVWSLKSGFRTGWSISGKSATKWCHVDYKKKSLKKKTLGLNFQLLGIEIARFWAHTLII